MEDQLDPNNARKLRPRRSVLSDISNRITDLTKKVTKKRKLSVSTCIDCLRLSVILIHLLIWMFRELMMLSQRVLKYLENVNTQCQHRLWQHPAAVLLLLKSLWRLKVVHHPVSV